MHLNTQPLKGKYHRIVTFFLPQNNQVVNNKSRLSVNIGLCLLQSVDYLGTPLRWGYVLCLHEGRGGQKSKPINLLISHCSEKRSSFDMGTCIEPLTRSEKEKSSKYVPVYINYQKGRRKRNIYTKLTMSTRWNLDITCQEVISQFMVDVLLDTNLPGGPIDHSITISDARFLTSRKHLTRFFISRPCPPLTY